MLEIFVCDDDVNITEYLKFFVMKYFGDEYRVITINKCQDLLNMIQFKDRVPDILIMDINLKDGNGIETVKIIQNTYPDLRVIYLTGIINYATNIFETNPAYFLLKPINEDKLKEAIIKVSGDVKAEKYDTIVIKSNGSEIIINRKQIIYVESQGRKLTLYMSGGTEYEIYEKMDVLQDALGDTFVRSHKSFLVNMKYIVERNNYFFCLSTGQKLPISKSNLKYAKLKFISYLGGE